MNKENQPPRAPSAIHNNGSTSGVQLPLASLEPFMQRFRQELTQLLQWIRAGENEVYLRQKFELDGRQGYSIPIFDFLVYFKDSDLQVDEYIPFRYLRRLYLAEYQVKVKCQHSKNLNFHKRHEIVLRIWHQLLRIIGSTPDVNHASNAPMIDENVCDENDFQQMRLSIIRGYMSQCQERPQSKTEQLRDLQRILKILWQIERQEEEAQLQRATHVSTTATTTTISQSTRSRRQTTVSATVSSMSIDPADHLRLLDFVRLWRTRYNNDSRIVVNTTNEQLEQRQLFCNSTNTLYTFFEMFQKGPCTENSIQFLMEQIGTFVMLNNARNAYNVALGSVKNLIPGKMFHFTMQEFLTDLFPYIRCSIHTLNRIAQLQKLSQLSLFESFWDVSFVAQNLNLIKTAVTQNIFSPQAELKSRIVVINNKAPSSVMTPRRKSAARAGTPAGGDCAEKAQLNEDAFSPNSAVMVMGD